MERRLAAILALDAVGFSAMAERDEEAAVRAVKGHLQAMEVVIGVNAGRVVKTLGDGLLAEFASVINAVAAAVAMQARLAERNADQPEKQQMLFRIGVHLGDVIVEDGDIFGEGVNIAARLETEAPPGGIAVSAKVFEEVSGKIDAAFSELGERKLKNIDRSIMVYSVTDSSQPATVQAFQTPDTRPNKPSVAVLPFLNLSTGEEQDYFADGLSEDIITALAHVPWIFVIARNSTFIYKGMAVDVRKVGVDLGVQYILEGSVRRAGQKLRVTGQLIDAENGTHVWADRFDGHMDDVFELQDRITDAVVAAIAPQIQHEELARAKRKRPDNLTAYDHYLRALSDLNKAQVHNAAEQLDVALTIAPEYAKAMAVRAWCISVTTAWASGRTEVEQRNIAVGLARRAIKIDREDVEVAAYAGYTIAFYSADIDLGMELVREATQRFPNFAWAWASLAMLEGLHGDVERTLEAGRNAIRLSPRDPLMFRSYVAMTCACILAGRMDEAVEYSERAKTLCPTAMVVKVHLINCLMELGRQTEAAGEAQTLMAQNPAFRVSKWVEHEKDFRAMSSYLSKRRAELLAAGLPE